MSIASAENAQRVGELAERAKGNSPGGAQEIPLSPAAAASDIPIAPSKPEASAAQGTSAAVPTNAAAAPSTTGPSVAPIPLASDIIFKRGDRGSASDAILSTHTVMDLQRVLVQAGCNIKVDGIYGPQTEAAVNAARALLGEQGSAPGVTRSVYDSLQLGLSNEQKVALSSHNQEFAALLPKPVVRARVTEAEPSAVPGHPSVVRSGTGEYTGVSLDGLDGMRGVLGIRLENLRNHGGGAFTKDEKQKLMEDAAAAMARLDNADVRASLSRDNALRVAEAKNLDDLSKRFSAYEGKEKSTTNTQAFWGSIAAGLLGVGIVAGATITAPAWGTAVVVGGTLMGITAIAMKAMGRGKDYGGGELAQDVAFTALPGAAELGGPLLPRLGGAIIRTLGPVGTFVAETFARAGNVGRAFFGGVRYGTEGQVVGQRTVGAMIEHTGVARAGAVFNQLGVQTVKHAPGIAAGAAGGAVAGIALSKGARGASVGQPATAEAATLAVPIKK